MQRKQLSTAIEVILTNPPEDIIESELLEGYEELNEKCDLVIIKIKKRKNKNGKK